MCVIFLPPDDGWDPMVPGGPVLIITHPDDFVWDQDWKNPSAIAVAESVRPVP